MALVLLVNSFEIPSAIMAFLVVDISRIKSLISMYSVCLVCNILILLFDQQLNYFGESLVLIEKLFIGGCYSL